MKKKTVKLDRTKLLGIRLGVGVARVGTKGGYGAAVGGKGGSD